MTHPRQSRITSSVLFYYALPTVTYGFMFSLVTLYFMKFATDVLLIAPAVMGLIFGISRIWDAVSDPLAGYWSDRTHSRFGRRRPWIAVCALPTALTYLMLFIQPEGLTQTGLVFWIGCGIIGFFSASTLFYVPHFALGAELTDSFHERNKIFASRHGGWIAGYIIGVFIMGWLISAGVAGGQEAMAGAAIWQAVIVAPLAALTLLGCAWGMRERKEFARKGSQHPFRAIRDVFRNNYARPPLIAYFLDNIGFAFASVLVLYVADYVLNDPGSAVKFMLGFLSTSFLLTPVWIPLARRFGKKNLWIFAMLLSAFSFGAIFFLGPGDAAWLMLFSLSAGIANGAGHVIGPSLLSDTVDYDELQTGERKEGAYFAAWNFNWKTANGLSLLLVGLVLSWSGFVPNVAQTPTALMAIKIMFSVVPFVFYILGVLVFLPYRLDEHVHRDMQNILQDRRQKRDMS